MEMMEARGALVLRALRLEYLTVGWNIVEGIIAVALAQAAGSVALLAFGIDSFVESTSAAILIWRLRAERNARDRHAIETLDRRAHRFVAGSLFLLGAFVFAHATWKLWSGDRPEPSIGGIILTSVSIATMLWLARAKRRAAHAIGSRALEADAFQTTACFWLSVITLSGMALNALFGAWWADPLAAIGVAIFVVKEGREAWRGDDCCDH